jgi:adenylate kinase family enzyme
MEVDGTVTRCEQALALVGPAASGTTTLARLAAAQLGWPCLSLRSHSPDSTTTEHACGEPPLLQELGGRLVLERGYAGLLDDKLNTLPPQSTAVVFDDITHPEMLRAIAARFTEC